MRKHKYKLTARTTALLIVIASLACIGVLLLMHTHAATYTVTREAEDGTITQAKTLDNAKASNGKSVQFGTASSNQPADILNLSNWELTLPIETDHAGNPDIIKQPELATFTLNPYFLVNSTHDGVVFEANAGGATTSGSSYPRSELREMTDNGTNEASWSDTSGTHTMTIREAITHLPDVKPHVVAAQIHDTVSDVVMVRLEGTKLFIEGDGNEIGVLDDNYQLGTIFSVSITAAGGHIKESYNGTQKVDYAHSGSGYYFKAGCYTQSNTSKGDAADAYGQVIIYNLDVSHT
jgi:poly(beta-D-mannuronate) lyase